MNEILAFASKIHADIILVVVMLILLVVVIVTLARAIARMIISAYQEKHLEEDKEIIRNTDFSTIKDEMKASYIRKMIAANGIDPLPNSYMVINDCGKDVYVRSFTISRLPKLTSFAETFAELMDFPNCVSSFFVEPISEQEMGQKLNKQITILDSEASGAAGSPNRLRQLKDQFIETTEWARENETGHNKFFNAGFLFSLYATSIPELNNISDTFRSLASKKTIEISSCYAAQAEAYLANAPMNKVHIVKGVMDADCIKYFMMDKRSVSTVYNYTQTTFTHKTGIPLGYDIFTARPFVYDIYNHLSFISILYGGMGSGKSATVKMIVARTAPLGYRFAAVDSQTLKGTNGGEYNPICRMLNGTVFQLSPDSENVLNLFDVAPSKKLVRTEMMGGYEKDTLDLDGKVSLLVDNLLTIIQQTKTIEDAEKFVALSKILKDACLEVYGDKGIINKDADSLYEEDMSSGDITSGRKRKLLPTLTDFYKKILWKKKINEESSLASMYDLILNGLSDYVNPIYYMKDSLIYISEDEYNSIMPDANGVRKIMNANKQLEEVVAVVGTATYFDGQSTLDWEVKSPFINIDISQLKEGIKKEVARQVSLSWLNECVINKNSEDLHSADKLLIIFDEAHESFVYKYARVAIERIVRTARKRNVGMLILTQTVSEFDAYEETKRIRDLASIHFIFPQPSAEKVKLKEVFAFTDSQINVITNVMRGDKKNEGEEERKSSGKVCVYDAEVLKCSFIQVAYFKGTERSVVETKAEELEKIIRLHNA